MRSSATTFSIIARTSSSVGIGGGQGEAIGDSGRQGLGQADTQSKGETPSNTGTHLGHRMKETSGAKKGDEGRQSERLQARREELKKAGTPSARSTMWEDSGKPGGARPRESGHTIKHRHTCGETLRGKGREGETIIKADTPSNKTNDRQTRGDETSGRRTQHPIQANMRGDNGTQ